MCIRDSAYAQYKDNESRRIADRKLAEKAWGRGKALDSGISERAYATAVAAAMKSKSAIGRGRRRKNKKNVSSRGRGGGGGMRKKKRTVRTTRKKKRTASGLYLRPYRKN